MGIAISIGPSMYHVLEPVRAWIERVLRWLYHSAIVPAVARLHRWGVIDFVGFLACWLLTASGYKMLRRGNGSNADAAEMVALTGSILVVPAFAYSGTLLIQPARASTIAHLTQLWLALCWIPSAIYFNSGLFAYLATLAVFGSLGFGVCARPLCIFIGFDTESAVHRCAIASFLLVGFFSALNVAASHGAAAGF